MDPQKIVNSSRIGSKAEKGWETLKSGRKTLSTKATSGSRTTAKNNCHLDNCQLGQLPTAYNPTND